MIRLEKETGLETRIIYLQFLLIMQEISRSPIKIIGTFSCKAPTAAIPRFFQIFFPDTTYFQYRAQNLAVYE